MNKFAFSRSYLSKFKFLNVLRFNYIGLKPFTSNSFKEKENAEEVTYVNKKEVDAIKKLLHKVKASQNKNHIHEEIADLKVVLNKHKIASSEDLIKDLQDWKEKHH